VRDAGRTLRRASGFGRESCLLLVFDAMLRDILRNIAEIIWQGCSEGFWKVYSKTACRTGVD